MDTGYINIRITRKAHKALQKEASRQKRTIVATMDFLLGITK